MARLRGYLGESLVSVMARSAPFSKPANSLCFV